MRYAFYDNEGTGISVRFDQITQFGGLICEDNLRISTSLNQRIRLLPYVVPSPEALEVTRQTFENICDPSLPSEFEAARRINAFLMPEKGIPTAYITYNGIQYDDELLRTTFHRNLLDPYFNSKSGCVRLDLLHVVKLVDHVEPDALIIPKNADGRKTYRLEALCPANGIKLQAHDALNDADATRRLFGLVRERVPHLIDIALRSGDPLAVTTLIRQATENSEPLFLFTSFGHHDVVPLAVIADDGKKRFVAHDLRFDLESRGAAHIAENLYKPGSSLHVITANKAPMIMTASEVDRLNLYKVSDHLREKTKDINHDVMLKSSCSEALVNKKYETVDNPLSEELIYGGYPSRADQFAMRDFHSANSWESRSGISFSNPALRDFAARVILEAAGTGECLLSENVRRVLATECGEALLRPYGRRDARYTTISQVMEKGTTPEWIAGASARYGDLSSFLPDPPKSGQLTLGF